MVTYTTAALVRKQIKSIHADLLDADIEDKILDAESLINSVMRDEYFMTNFDASKHRIIRTAATCLTAVSCIAYDSSGFATRDQAAYTMDVLLNEITRSLALLFEERTKAWLKGL